VTAGREDFEAFVAAQYDALLRTAYLLTGDHHDAEDLLQQALVRAVGAWGRIDGDPGPYVRTILVRQNVSRWRGRRWRELHTAEPPEVGVSDDGADDRIALHRALGSLAPRQRAVIVLRYYEDLSEADIATELGLSVGTVKSHASRALAALRSHLGDDQAPAARTEVVR
jgi:RNA polymerase sigma-70 factor (sigma-E family)